MDINVDSALRPELINYCHKELGHALHWLRIQSVNDLRAIVRSKRRYNPDYKKADPVIESHAEPLPMADVQPMSVAPSNPLTPANPPKLGALIDALSADLADTVAAKLRPEFMALVESKPREVTLSLTLGETVKNVTLGICHKMQTTLIKKLLARVNVYLHGPAGSGKTTACRLSAKALSEALGREIKFYAFSADETMQTYQLLGYRNASDASIVRTQFRDAWEHGGLFLLDEMDTAPGLLTVLNMALDNGLCAFPDGLIPMHADFFFVGGGNTIGKGADSTYVSRNRQDGATMTRFAFIRWDYDEALELAAAGVDQRAWVEHVQKIRKAISDLGVSAPDLLVSPRASIYGARELRTDNTTTFAELEEAYIWQGCSEDDRAKVRAQMRRK